MMVVSYLANPGRPVALPTYIASCGTLEKSYASLIYLNTIRSALLSRRECLSAGNGTKGPFPETFSIATRNCKFLGANGLAEWRRVSFCKNQIIMKEIGLPHVFSFTASYIKHEMIHFWKQMVSLNGAGYILQQPDY